MRIYALLAKAAASDSAFAREGAVDHINKAIDYRSQAISLTPEGHAERPDALHALGVSYCSRFEYLGDLADMDMAIKCQSEALSLTTDEHVDRAGRLSNLGSAYWYRYERLRKLEDVDMAIAYQNQSLTLTSDDDEYRPYRLGSLGTSYLSRFGRHGELSDLGTAIDLLRQALSLTPDDDENRPSLLNNLGTAYQDRFEWTTELADLEKAIECHSHAVLLTPDDHTDKPSCLNNLGNSYLCRFERLGELSDVNQAIEHQSQAVMLAPTQSADRSTWLSNLGNSYMRLFECVGEPADIVKAIEHHNQANLLTPYDHPDKPRTLTNLGNSHMYRWKHLGDSEDLNKAIECQSQAAALTSDSHPHNPSVLSNLGTSYYHRFERTGDLANLHTSIELRCQALSLTPDGHADRPSLLNNLGNSYQCRFERLGELADIDKAIDCLAQAKLRTPDGHAGKSRVLNNLGNSYRCRFERLREQADADKAVECLSQAVMLTPDGHSNKPGWLTNLGNAYLSRGERLGEPSDIHQAIKYHSQAIMLMPDSHLDKPSLFNNLGRSYKCLFNHIGQREAIDKAVECHSQAALLTPNGHALKPGRLNNLGNSYANRSETLGQLKDLDLAIECQRQAELLTPDGHSFKPSPLNSLGNSYMRRFKLLGSLSDVENASMFFQRAAQLSITNPEIQFRSARNWAKCSSLIGTSPRLAFQRAMQLVPQLIWLGTTIDQRRILLVDIRDIALEAAAWAISVQEYELALEWLEQGRSIVWNQLLQLRTPFDDLSAENPEIARRLKEISRDLEHAGSRSATVSSDTTNETDLEQAAQYHRRLATEWDHLLAQARQLPGFCNFMNSHRACELIAAAKDGPIAIINVFKDRCDALLILQGKDKIGHIPLVNFSQAKAIEAGERMKAVIQPGWGRGLVIKPCKPASTSERMFRVVLAMLWSDITEPILDYLGYTVSLINLNETVTKHPYSLQEKTNGKLPHITWCTTGPISFLPLHAAGLYDGLHPNTPDLVISSYIPTLGALLSLTPSAVDSSMRLLAVGQASTKGLNDLPHTVHELAVIKESAKATCYLQLDGNNATIEAVLQAMEEHNWVHLACHAIQHTSDPAYSAFHLSNGTLTLETIAKRAFKDKGLAFLSACQTATGDSKLPDEAIHLAGGMLMAGYPSVIATMWSIYDVDGPQVAGRVYTELLKDGKMDHRGAARVLHQAVAELREKVEIGSFTRWVPFIHIGM